MKIKCKTCGAENKSSGVNPKLVQKYGVYYRTSDRKKVQRFYCRGCKQHFSVASLSRNYLQKKRHFNHKVARILVAGVSQRECARILGLNRKTIVRKFVFMAEAAQYRLAKLNKKRPKVSTVEFDDLESFEHTKCKPLSVTLAVESKSRWIMGFEVSSMPAKGPLARIAMKKYGPREDKRAEAREKLFKHLGSMLSNRVVIRSDQNPHYLWDVRQHFPKAEHVRYKGRKGCIVGQGELKKIGFDPLFSLNHTCAVLRYRASRLIRRTWNTTKKQEGLVRHLALISLHHNLSLLPTILSTL